MDCNSESQRRIALVTGASRGIGRAIARRLSADFHVVVAARHKDGVQEAVRELRQVGGSASGLVCDVGDRGSAQALIDSMAEKFGRVDALVNNAGVLPQAELAETVDREAWDATLEINLTSAWYLATRIKPMMPAGSVIVNMTSSAAYYPSRGLVAYNVSKAGLVMLTRVLAVEWAGDGIRVLAVAPGKIDTDMLEPIKAWAAKRNLALNPMGRIGDPSEVAELVAFLISTRASFLTGVTVPVDGGELLQTSGGGL